MKINVEVDCTPEEARAAMGLPDLSPLHDRYIAMAMEAMQGGVSPEMLDTLLKGWAPMGEAGLNFWRRMLEGGTKTGG